MMEPSGRGLCGEWPWEDSDGSERGTVTVAV